MHRCIKQTYDALNAAIRRCGWSGTILVIPHDPQEKIICSRQGVDTELHDLDEMITSLQETRSMASHP